MDGMEPDIARVGHGECSGMTGKSKGLMWWLSLFLHWACLSSFLLFCQARPVEYRISIVKSLGMFPGLLFLHTVNHLA